MSYDGDNAAAARRSLEVGTPQHFRWLHQIVKVVIILNVVDACFTLARGLPAR